MFSDKHTARLSRRINQNHRLHPFISMSTLLVCSFILLVQITLVISTSSAAGAPDAAVSSQKSQSAFSFSVPVIEPEIAAPVSSIELPNNLQPNSSSTSALIQQSQSSDVNLSHQPKPTPTSDAAAAAAVAIDKTAERKARADADSKSSSGDYIASTSQANPSDSKSPAASAPDATKSSESKTSSDSNATSSATVSKSSLTGTPSKPLKQQTLTGKSGSGGKNKLPANLGTVTSTGSGGPAHYLSKHDAYSAIAEKHGSLSQMASAHHKKSDSKRATSIQRFGGIQKASGLGDMLTPFKGVTDSGLARTLGASMRSIMKSKYSVPAYVASALLGAVALMAFYESPMSPLPVPALPEPPIGRFPPEMPNISPNVVAPFRTNGGGGGNGQYYNGQNYNQRSLQAQPNGQIAVQQSTANNQQQQVFFPGFSAQQRQLSAGQSSAGSLIGGQVQQMAANLLSVGKQQNAQRKSGPDYDPATMARSFLSAMAGNAPAASNNNPYGISKLSGPSGQRNPASSSATSSFLSYFGLGSSSSPAQSSSGSSQPPSSPASPNDNMSFNNNMNGPIVSASSSLESKAQLLPSPSSPAASLSGSHLVNKVKSMFARAPATNAAGNSVNQNMYDQYSRMSLVQALMKDTAFLPAFLSPTRKSSAGSPSSASGPLAAASKLQSIANAISSVASSQLSSQGSNSIVGPAARMQVDVPMLPVLSGQPITTGGPSVPTKQRATSGHGLMRAADRLAHVLLETLTSGFIQKSAPAAAHKSQPTQPAAERKSSDSNTDSVSNQQQQQQQNSQLVAATSLLSDIVSSYNNRQAAVDQLGAAMLDSAQAKSAQQQSSAANSNLSNQQQTSPSSAHTTNGRSNEESSSSSDNDHKKQDSPPVKHSSPTPDPSSSSSSSSVSTGTVLSRKTRSVGFEYPIENDQMIALRESLRRQQQQQHPSRAAQINNFVDFVSDSYSQNKLLVNFVMNHVGLGHAVPYVEQILASGSSSEYQH